MRNLFITMFLLTSLSACSSLQDLIGGGDKPDKPVVREQFNPCPFLVNGANHPSCPKSGAAKGGVCLPSGEYHSVAEKCDKL